MNKKIQPLHDRVLIREHKDDKETKTKSGIIIPVAAQEDKGSKKGEVVAVGAGKHETGRDGGKSVLVPLSVKVGDVVLFQWGDQIKIDGEEFFIVRESEILAIIK